MEIIGPEGATVFVMAAAIAVMIAAAVERFGNYINTRKRDRLHDSHLWGFKLSLIIVLCGVIMVLSVGTTLTVLYTSKRQRETDAIVKFICERIKMNEERLTLRA